MKVPLEIEAGRSKEAAERWRAGVESEFIKQYVRHEG
jgi:hypothetical protein